MFHLPKQNKDYILPNRKRGTGILRMNDHFKIQQLPDGD